MNSQFLLSILLLLSTISTAQIINIPDANFKAYLIADTNINSNNDTEIQQSEAAAYTGIISVANQGVTDLTGIEEFVALTELDCSNNQLGTLDVSANVALTSLYCNTCQLTSLNVATNTNLVKFSCYANQLTTINLSMNTLLEEFYCYNNQLTSLNLDNNGSLTRFFGQVNQLTTLSVKNGNYNNVTHFNVTSNPNLSCIDVDDVAYATANWDHIDAGVTFSVNCFTTTSKINTIEHATRIYPQPVLDELIIELPKSYSSIELMVYNSIGQKSVYKTYQNTRKIHLTLPREMNGIYWLQLTTEDGLLKQKIIKQ